MSEGSARILKDIEEAQLKAAAEARGDTGFVLTQEELDKRRAASASVGIRGAIVRPEEPKAVLDELTEASQVEYTPPEPKSKSEARRHEVQKSRK